MRKTRLVGAILIVVVLTAVLVPLCIASLVMASETPLSHQQFVRISRAESFEQGPHVAVRSPGVVIDRLGSETAAPAETSGLS
jgi:hypothetical protein